MGGPGGLGGGGARGERRTECLVGAFGMEGRTVPGEEWLIKCTMHAGGASTSLAANTGAHPIHDPPMLVR